MFGRFGKGLEPVTANGGRFEINQLLFADHTALYPEWPHRQGGCLAC